MLRCLEKQNLGCYSGSYSIGSLVEGCQNVKCSFSLRIMAMVSNILEHAVIFFKKTF